MTGLIPAQRGPWTEAEGRRLVTARASQNLDGVPTCELCGDPHALEWAHRISRGRGGDWSPSNGVLLCRTGHRWAHANPTIAGRLGLEVPTWAVPSEVPVWLPRPWPGWWLLQNVDALLVPAHREDHPDLPTDAELAELLPPAARGALR